MKILGIDPGLADTGWGVIQCTAENGRRLACSPRAEAGRRGRNADWLVVDYGNISTNARDAIENRLSDIHAEVMDLIKKYEPDVVTVEELYFGVNVKTAMKVGQARGAVILAAGDCNLQVANYAPNKIKIALTGYGHADKQQVQEMVKRFLKLDKVPKPDHAADALACAYCHAVSNQRLG